MRSSMTAGWHLRARPWKMSGHRDGLPESPARGGGALVSMRQCSYRDDRAIPTERVVRIVEQGQEGGEIALVRGLCGNAFTSSRRCVKSASGCAALDAATRSARELAGGGAGAIHDRRNLVERQIEQVVQYEADALGRRERVEHDEQRKGDRIGQAPCRAPHRARRAGLDRGPGERLSACLGAKHVETQARDDGRQPCGDIVKLGRVAAVQAEAGFLHRRRPLSVREPRIR